MKEKVESMFNNLTEEELEKVNGGFAAKQYQLYYQGQPLDMTVKICDLCVTYPELKEVLGSYSNTVANFTLNSICQLFGEGMIQGLIDSYVAD